MKSRGSLRGWSSVVLLVLGWLAACAGSLRAIPPLECPGCPEDHPAPPSAALTRARLLEIAPAAPRALEPLFSALLSLGDAALGDEVAAVAALVRSRSTLPRPTHPCSVGALEVQRWVLDVVLTGDLAALRPVAEWLPPSTLRWGWVRAAELSRGMPAGACR